MNAGKIVPVILVALVLALAAGCTTPSPSGGGGATPGGGGGEQNSLLAAPVVTLPAGFMVEFQVDRDPIATSREITVTFRGGEGQMLFRGAKVMLIREDGTTDTKYFSSSASNQIKVGDSVTFQGSTGTDRVIIVVTTGGKEYKVLDRLYEFKSHL